MVFRSGMILILVAQILLAISCKGSKELASANRAIPVKSEAAQLYETLSNGDNYSWYTGKARIKANTPDARMSATVTLRMQKDQVIWAMIEKLGFEIARVLISPDSVFIVDRLNKEYTKDTLKRYLNAYGVHVGFEDLQNALIGRMVSLSPVQVEAMQESDLSLLVVSDQNGVTARHWVTQSLPQRLVKSLLIDAGGRTLQIENAQWEVYGDGTEIPFERMLTFEDAGGMTEIEIIFSEITKNIPASIPFSIPEHYAKAR